MKFNLAMASGRFELNDDTMEYLEFDEDIETDGNKVKLKNLFYRVENTKHSTPGRGLAR